MYSVKKAKTLFSFGKYKMHVNIKYKTKQPKSYSLEACQDRIFSADPKSPVRMIKDTWKVAGQGAGSFPQGHCIFVMRTAEKKTHY